MTKDELAEVRNGKIGFVFQGFNLLSRTSAVDNVELPLLYSGLNIKSAERRRRAMESLEAVGLGARFDHHPNQLSGGQQQRVAIARALITRPSILLADEPTGNLDTRTSIEVMGIFQKLSIERGITVLVITHEHDIAEYGTRVITCRDGLIVSDHPVAQRRTAETELAALPENVKSALKFYGLKENAHGIPSQRYGNIVGGQNMFDGFGWEGLEIKRPDFYQALIKAAMSDARPADETGADFKRWKLVSAWVEKSRVLNDLQGGVVDHVVFANDAERAMFDREMAAGVEREHVYFWHNQPYTPKRSFLYQFLCIASGYIPPRLNITSALDADGNVKPVAHESVDDDWLLISPEHDHGTMKLLQLVDSALAYP
ncbi:MAG: ATP-binding cassette domain-containing protein, partial [Verrucomicrobiaceae bacterium]